MSVLTRRKVSVVAGCALVVLLLAVAAGPTLAVEPWAFTQYTPSPTAQSLTGGCALDANNVWAGGGSSTIAYYDGSTWVTQANPGQGMSTVPFIGGLAAADSTHIWAAGDNLNIMFSDGSAGGNWQSQSGTTTAADPDFYACDALGSTSAWAAGSGGTIYKYTSGTWANDNVAGGIADGLRGISALDADNVWAAGYDGSNNGHIYYRGVGHTWNTTPQHTITGVRLRSICAIDANHVWAVGNGGTILFYDGTSWAASPQSGVITTSDLYMVNATSNENVWSAGSGNTILNFDGTTWTRFTSPDATANHRTALPAGTGSIWTTGQGGKIFSGAIMRIASCDPTWGAQGQTLDVDIVGTETSFVNGTSVATFSGTEVTVNSTTVTDHTHATANITIAAGAAPGARDVNVTTGAETPNALMGGFTVRAMHTITVNAGANGTITPAGPVKVLDGDDKAFTITPAAGYHTVDVVIDGVHLGAVTNYTFENVTTDHAISATFSNAYPTWYLPEGSTAWGFGAGINIENPNDEDLNAKVTYMLAGGTTKEQTVGLPKMSQVTVLPGDTVGIADFSTKVECVQGKTIAVDRTMMWVASSSTQASGAHNSIGVTAPSTTWYLPEGSSNWGFETWLLIQNPNDVEASCNVTYMIEGVGPKTINHVVPEHSRATFNMADEIGNADASIKVDSNIGVIPERAMYTSWVSPTGQAMRREGHDSVGTTQAATAFYLAEGSTRWGFTTYVLVQNPNLTQAKVTLTCMNDNGPLPNMVFTMPPNSRKTVRVNDTYPGTDLSTRVCSDKPIVAERSMFWGDASTSGLATHDSIGTSAAHMTWCLPDGGITPEDGGAETFTLVQNPNNADVEVRISYLNEGGKDNVVFTDTVRANSRKTYNMADKYAAGTSASASIMVESLTAGKKIVVERSMYVNGRWGGTNTIGGWTD